MSATTGTASTTGAAAMAALVMLVTLGGCGFGAGSGAGTAGTAAATVSATAATAGTAGTAGTAPDGLTGIGATRAVWNAHHGGGHGYQAVDTDAAGRVEGYVLAMSPRSLALAIALVRRDLPADAVIGAARVGSGVEGTQCEIVAVSSASLGAALGGPRGDRLTAVFMSASAVGLDPAEISSAAVVSGDEAAVSGC